jgi:hypothetical protein
LILLTWDELDRARHFAKSDDLREALNQAAVTDEPDLWILEDISQVEF